MSARDRPGADPAGRADASGRWRVASGSGGPGATGRWRVGEVSSPRGVLRSLGPPFARPYPKASDRRLAECQPEPHGKVVASFLLVSPRERSGRGRLAAALLSQPLPLRLPQSTAPLRLQHGQAVLGAADEHVQALLGAALGGTDRFRRPQEGELPLDASDRLVELIPGGPAW